MSTSEGQHRWESLEKTREARLRCGMDMYGGNMMGIRMLRTVLFPVCHHFFMVDSLTENIRKEVPWQMTFADDVRKGERRAGVGTGAVERSLGEGGMNMYEGKMIGIIGEGCRGWSCQEGGNGDGKKGGLRMWIWLRLKCRKRIQKIGTTGDGKSAVATLDGRSRKKKKITLVVLALPSRCRIGISCPKLDVRGCISRAPPLDVRGLKSPPAPT